MKLIVSNSDDEEEQDNVYSEHTGRRFCSDSTCPDKEDQDAVNSLNDDYQNGLVSRSDIDRIYAGRTV